MDVKVKYEYLINHEDMLAKIEEFSKPRQIDCRFRKGFYFYQIGKSN